MFPEKISEHVQMARKAEEWLKKRGSYITETRVWMRRPLLEITCPPAELVKSASRIMESCDTGTRSVWVARLNGCQIIWR